MTGVFWARRFGEGQYAQFAGLIATQQAWFAQFQANATPEQWASLASTLADPKVAFAEGCDATRSRRGARQARRSTRSPGGAP
jgi:hypothetical protein